MAFKDIRRSHALLIVVVIVLICYIISFTEESYSPISGKVKQEQSSRAPCGEDSDDVYLIPQDEELREMDSNQLTAVYWRYINTLQTLCRNVFRFGTFKDGGKEICLDSQFNPKQSCLVYSFGSNFKFDFELAVIQQFGCEVHTFDPTMNVDPLTWKAPGNVVFHKVGLAGVNNVTQKMKTLGTIMRDLKHENSTIDILKIDIEGWEWKALPEALRTGSLQRAKQIAVEVHFRPNYATMMPQLKVLRDLYEGGFRIFMRERNLVQILKFQSKHKTDYTTLNEISLINTRFKAP